MKTHLRLLAATLAALLGACSSGGDTLLSGPPTVPPDPATTGNKWMPEDDLGGTCFKLVDEECGGIGEADYFSYFEAPIFRTGHVIGSTAYAVDGTNIWIVDLTDPATPTRLGIVTGVGRALAITGQGDRLYVAAAERGLVEFRIEAQAPAQLERLHEVPLEGPALDVALSTDGTEAFVALGGAGLGRVKLDGEAPVKGAKIQVAGHAAGVSVGPGPDGTDLVYVAACSSLSVLDPVQGSVIGSLGLQALATEAPMPIKDVTVAEGLALIAAGRWGLVAVDVTMPAHPMLLGNLTLPEDLLYYANGVTVSHGQVYIAAGDWGVDRKPLAELHRSLAHEPPTRFARYCTATDNPEREPAPEFRTRLPPPRNQDPLDVLPFGDHLLAMGDASRLGVRAIDVYTLDAAGAHTLAGRYEEPGLVSSIAAGGGAIAVAGRVSGLFAPDATRLLQRASAPLEGKPRIVALDRQARLIALDEQGALSVDGKPIPEAGALAPMLAVSGERLAAVHAEGGVELIALTDSEPHVTHRLESAPFLHGATHAFVGDKLFLSSGEWERVGAIDLGAPGERPTLLDRPLITRADLDNPGLWRLGPPRRVLVGFGDYLAEAVSFGGRASAILRQVTGGVSHAIPFSIPASGFVGGASDADRRLWLVQGDRATYRTTVTEVDFSAGFDLTPVQTSQVFLGTAVGAALLDQRLYVADREVGVRVFQVTETGLEYLGATDLREEP